MYHKWNKTDELKVRQMIEEGKDDQYIANVMWTTKRRVAMFRKRKHIGHPLDPSPQAQKNRVYCYNYYHRHHG